MRLATLALFALAAPVMAEDVHVQPVLGLEGARALVAEAIDFARAQSAPGGAIAVVDSAGTLVVLERLDGTFPAAPGIAIGKARTAALFRKPTRVFEDIVNQGRFTMTTLPDVAAFTPLQGGVPVEVDGAVVGAVGVSGAASAQQDDDIASAAVAAFTRKRQERHASVTHVPADVVAEAFRVDATVAGGDGYRVNASRRDRPGEAEVHLDDTDIFYVLEGRATLVTGGEVVSPRRQSEREIRGPSIANGTENVLARGDVITVPAGVPHWFSQVEGPFVYYVVKSTRRGA